MEIIKEKHQKMEALTMMIMIMKKKKTDVNTMISKNN